MKNTYINEDRLNAHPFDPSAVLTFPASCIVNAGFNIKTDAPVRVLVSSVHIEAGGMSLVICIEKEVDGIIYTPVVGKISIDTTAQNATGYVENIGSDVKIWGYATAGSVHQNDYGTYTGKFYIDPSCVYCTTSAVFGRHTTLNINGVTYVMPEVLDIACAGILQIDDDCAISADVSDTDELTVYNESGTYRTVTSINNQEVSILGDTTLEFTTAHPDAILFEVTGSATSSCVTVTIDGTKEFPNCYDPEKDEAKSGVTYDKQ